MSLARNLHELPECAVQSGDKPAAGHFVLPGKTDLLFYIIEIIK